MIKRVGVVGVGTMGQGIAEMLAEDGLDVFRLEQSTERLEDGLHMIEASLDKQIEKWAITTSEKTLILSRIHAVQDINELANCELIIESAFEDLEIKKQL